MSWNEPPKGDGNNPQDPWRSHGRKNNDGPPGLDEILRQLKNKLNKYFGRKSGDSGKSAAPSKGSSLFTLVLGILLVLWFSAGIYRVEQAEQAVILRFGQFYEITGAGLQWRMPWIDSVEKVNTGRVRTQAHQATILTHDKNIVDMQVEVQYRVNKPKAFVFSIQDPIGVLAQATESALRQVVGSSDMGNVITEGRHAIAQDVRRKIQRYLDAYSSGIEVTKVNIEDAHPPNDVKAAFDDVIKAKEDEERLKSEAQAYANGVIPEARGLATRQAEEAEAYKREVLVRAQGEAERFTQLLPEYRRAPEVMRQRLYIEMMESILSKTSKVMIATGSNNNLIYLPLDKLMKETPEVGVKSPTTIKAPIEVPPESSVKPNRFGREDR